MANATDYMSTQSVPFFTVENAVNETENFTRSVFLVLNVGKWNGLESKVAYDPAVLRCF